MSMRAFGVRQRDLLPKPLSHYLQLSGGDARVAGLRRDSEELFRVRVLEELRAQV